ncbi:MAG: winged helix-turn-helix domain-containing protein, partial [Pseudomonadota bacterium]
AFDPAARQIFHGDQALDVPRRELAVFECLLSSDGRIVSKAALLDYAYGVGADVDEKVIEVYVSRLRARLKPFGLAITARRGLGYALGVEDRP